METNQNKRSFGRYMADRKKENPFYQNYLFSKEDLKRVNIRNWQYPLLWLLPTYVQIAEGYEFHFKLWRGQIFLMKIAPY